LGKLEGWELSASGKKRETRQGRRRSFRNNKTDLQETEKDMASSLLEQWGAIRPTDRNTHSELTEIRTCPPNRSYIVGMEVTGLAPDVEPLPHQALGPRELQVTATHQGAPRHGSTEKQNKTKQNN